MMISLGHASSDLIYFPTENRKIPDMSGIYALGYNDSSLRRNHYQAILLRSLTRVCFGKCELVIFLT